MPLFSYKCPQCNRVTLIDPRGKCLNKLGNGEICGYQLPFSYNLANRKLRTKWAKHSAPPEIAGERTYSWTDGYEAYGYDRQTICTQGTVTLDPERDFLFLWHIPYETATIASVQYATAGTVASANGIIMPLNTRLQNLHHYYGNLSTGWETIGAGHDLVIEEPCDKHPSEYWVRGPDGLEYRFNPWVSKGDSDGKWSI